MNTQLIKESAQAACRLLKAMSNENRLMILCQLAGGEKTAGELETIIGLSQSALSQHLAILRISTVVNTRREAQNIYYSLAEPQPRAVIETLYQLYSKEA